MGGEKMNSITELHNLAMDLAEYALFAKTRGDMRVVRELTQRAFEYEAQAADLVAGLVDEEPSRALLHRSAASLAIRCGEYDEANRLIIAGLAGNPPGDLAAELQALMKEVKKQKRKSMNGTMSEVKQHSA